MNAAPITVLEPQMQAEGHAGFNAALLHTVVLAYPESAICFRGLPLHQQAVREVLSQHAPELDQRIEWKGLPVPAGGSVVSRWQHSDRLLREVLQGEQRLLFCSISRRQLLQLKRLMRSRDSSAVRVVHHGDLDLLDEPDDWRSSIDPFSFKRILLAPNPERLGHLVLGQAIYDNIPERFRRALGRCGVIDHPYHFVSALPAVADAIVFGVFGNSGDGRLLAEVAAAVRSAEPAARLRLIGFVADDEAVRRIEAHVEDAGSHPIPRPEFLARAASVTHALWLAPAGSYRLRASGTFFDALAYQKPLVYTANAYVDAYYRDAPAIGWRCESLAEVEETTLRVIRGRSDASYAAAQAAMLSMRERFTPEAQAKLLPTALAWD